MNRMHMVIGAYFGHVFGMFHVGRKGLNDVKFGWFVNRYQLVHFG